MVQSPEDAIFSSAYGTHIDPSRQVEKSTLPRVFAGGHRIYMNIMPMFLCVMIPWAMYVTISGVTSFCGPVRSPVRSYSALVLGVIICLFLIVVAIRARKSDPEPTWYSYLALATTLAYIIAIALGHQTCVSRVLPFLHLQQFKTVTGLAPSRTPGENALDAGIVEFERGTHMDNTKAWHFKMGTTYCVAPLVSSGEPSPQTLSYDFWVVGKDCCATAQADFRCGHHQGPGNPSGLRVMDTDDLPYYRLAVQQAETTFGLQAAHPIFFTWSANPLLDLQIYQARTYQTFLYGVFVSLVVFFFLVAMAAAKFSFIGRGPWKFDRKEHERRLLNSV